MVRIYTVFLMFNKAIFYFKINANTLGDPEGPDNVNFTNVKKGPNLRQGCVKRVYVTLIFMNILNQIEGSMNVTCTLLVSLILLLGHR